MDMATKHSTATTAFKTARKQKAVIEYKNDGGPEWWVLTPYGDVGVFDTASHALKCVQSAARKGNRGVTFTTIEWRNVPAGFVPPGGSK
jgi:hypothetical protein